MADKKGKKHFLFFPFFNFETVHKITCTLESTTEGDTIINANLLLQASGGAFLVSSTTFHSYYSHTSCLQPLQQEQKQPISH